MPQVTGMDFIKQLKKIESKAAPGVDGRTEDELKRFAQPVCIVVADIWDPIMRHDNPTLPKQLTMAGYHLIPKPSQKGPA